MEDKPNLMVELLVDFNELVDFSCGEEQMDEFIHGNLKDCSINHYCTTYCVRNKDNREIAAIFSLSFDSVDIDQDDFDDMRIGAAGTDKPHVTDSFRERFEEKYTYPALEITYLAVDKKYQHMSIGAEIVEDVCAMARKQSLAGCIFVTVLALHKSGYSAVPFYEKCHFAKQTPLPKADVWPMYKTLWVEETE